MARARSAAFARPLEDAMDPGDHVCAHAFRRQERDRWLDRVPELRPRLPRRCAGAAAGCVRPWRRLRPATRGDRRRGGLVSRAAGAAGSASARGSGTSMSSDDPHTIAALWRGAVTAGRTAPAYLVDSRDSWREVSWAEAGSRVDEFAHGLLELGIKRGDRVAILGSTRIEWALLDFALCSLGAVVVPIYPTSSQNECAYILADAEVRAIAVEDDAQRDKIDE